MTRCCSIFQIFIINVFPSRYSPENPDLLTTLGLLFMQVCINIFFYVYLFISLSSSLYKNGTGDDSYTSKSHWIHFYFLFRNSYRPKTSLSLSFHCCTYEMKIILKLWNFFISLRGSTWCIVVQNKHIYNYDQCLT